MDCSSDESSEHIDDYAEIVYMDLKSGKLVARRIARFRCPFCHGKKKQDCRYTYGEIRNMQSAACEHSLIIVQETDQLRKQLNEKGSGLKRRSKQLSEIVAQTDMERRKLENDKKKGVADLLNPLSDIGIKRMGELCKKPFIRACKEIYGTQAETKALEFCSLWQEDLKDANWYPFKVVTTGETSKEIIDEGDEKLVSLKKQLGEEVYRAVTTALVEINEYSASGSYVVSELWNNKENAKANVGEVMEHIPKQRGTVVQKACQEATYEFFDSCSCGEAAVLREGIGQLDELIKVEIIFPYGSTTYAAKKHDTMHSVLEDLGKQVLSDSYYLCGGRLLGCTTTFSDFNISNGCRIIVNPRVRGGVNGSSTSVPLSIDFPVTKVPFLKRVKELEERKKWLQVVQVPESLSMEDVNTDPFVVMLGIGGSSTLLQVLLCFERIWASDQCLNGKFSLRDLYFIKEYGTFRVCVDPSKFVGLTQDGFRKDTLRIADNILDGFRYRHKRETRKVFPMYLHELHSELKTAGFDPDYFYDAKKRSLIHNSASTMTPEQRVQIFTAIIRYWKRLEGDSLEKFSTAMDPEGPEENLWNEKVKTGGKILADRFTFRGKRYFNTYLSLLDYSRCLFEHGPTAQVSERQCEAALYLIKPNQFTHFHKQLLTVYKEEEVTSEPQIVPPVSHVGEAAQQSVPGVQEKAHVDVQYLRSAAAVVSTIPVGDDSSIEDIFVRADSQ